MKKYFSEFRISWLLILTTLIIGGLTTSIMWYEHKYPCVSGHYEEQWVYQWCTDANGYTTMCGGYWDNVFICDCRTERKD